ncbi:MAG TPA: hypothetical protein PK668_26925 [Myxococcota bacterium]|nr:hypothetical protein [Myxococcota bacterium]HRY97162.1 hypothetical protein [Myxococcota bacterium]
MGLMLAGALGGCGAGEESCSDVNPCLAGTACDRSGQCVPAEPLRILEPRLADGVQGAEYADTLHAAGGIPPYTFALGGSPGWLRLAPGANQGEAALSGIPTETCADLAVEIDVTDTSYGDGQTLTATLLLSVQACLENDIQPCSYALDGRCLNGSRTCEHAVWGSCNDGVASTALETCGPECVPCEASADNCRQGLCACGAEPVCAGALLCCAGACLDGVADPANCGACGRTCSPEEAHALASWCADSACDYDACQPGFLDCDGDRTNGCETLADEAACGACGRVCADFVQGATGPTCAGEPVGARSCDYDACEPGALDCDGDRANGCETPVGLEDCEGCGLACATQCVPSPAGDGHVCACSLDGDCFADQSCCEGRCASHDEPAHCGGCGLDCTSLVEHVERAQCALGACTYDRCAAGFLDCDGDRADGCETTVSADDCGACGHACGPDATCADPTGDPACACVTPHEDCNQSWQDGCEADLQQDPARCGRCDRDCQLELQHATGPLCEAGICDYTSCAPGYGDCDAERSDGCETHLWLVDACRAACGEFAMNCLDRVAHVLEVRCTGGCGYSVCALGYGDCDSDPANGCEVSIWVPSGCGLSCAERIDCTQQVQNAGDIDCTAGACSYGACLAGFGDCDMDRSDGCERPLWLLQSCRADCFLAPADCTQEIAHASGADCNEGACDYSTCEAGYRDCDLDRTNGCEADLWRPEACRVFCEDPGVDCTAIVLHVAEVLCAGGGCGYTACSVGYGDCNQTPWDGCETGLVGNDQDCGACDRACLASHGTNDCVGMACEPDCDPLYGDCDDEPWDGCETYLFGNIQDCGVCNRACTNAHGSTACVSTSCVPTCSGTYRDCDGEPWDGCETNVLDNPQHCGSCDEICGGGTSYCCGSTCRPTPC